MSVGLVNLLKALASEDKSIREEGERLMEGEWMSRPSALFSGLIGVVADRGADRITRMLGGVLLRKAVGRMSGVAGSSTKMALWEQLDAGSQAQCRSSLLQCLVAEQHGGDELVQHKLADAVAEIARVGNAAGEWGELAAFVLGGESVEGGGIGLRILGAVPEAFVVSVPRAKQVAGLLGGVLLQRVSAPQAGLEALRALVAVLLLLVEEEEAEAEDGPAPSSRSKSAAGSMAAKMRREFQPLANAMPSVVQAFAEDKQSADHEAHLVDVLNLASECVEACPRMFRSTFGPLFRGTVGQLVDSSSGFGEDVRSAALELVMTLCEGLPRQARKDPEGLGQLVFLLLKATAEVPEDIAEWAGADPDAEDAEGLEGEGLSQFGEQCLDRVSISLGGTALLQPFFGLIPQMLAHTDWRFRYAGLKAIASITEGCLDQLEDRIGSLLGLVWPAFSDPHPRVQYAACHALGQLCTDFDGAIQEDPELSTKALASLLSLLAVPAGPGREPRVQAHAAAALINFSEGVPPHLVAPYLDDIMGALVHLLTLPSAPGYLRVQLMATIAAFSTPAGKSFTKYYSTIVPLLLGALHDAPAADALPETDENIRCRALECISLVYLAIGWAQIPADDLNSLVALMVRLQQHQQLSTMASFLASAWVRLAQVMKHNFAPLLPLVVPGLLEEAGQQPDMAILDAGDSLEAYDQDEWEFATLRGKRLGIRTSTLEAKLVAVEHLTVYVDAVGSAYLPMAQATLQVALPLLRFDLHEGIQGAAAALLANLVGLLRSPELTAQAISGLLEALGPAYYQPEYTAAALDALADVFSEAPELAAPALPSLFQSLSTLLGILWRTTVEQRSGPHPTCSDDGEEGEEEDDGEDGGEEAEDEEAVLYALGRLLAAVYSTNGPAAAGMSGELMAFCQRVVQAPLRAATPSMKHACVCIFDDFIRHAPLDALYQFIGPILAAWESSMTFSFHDDNDLMQSVVFGFGIAAERVASNGDSSSPKDTLTAFLQTRALPLLQTCLRAKNARAPSRMTLTDNVVSAYGRLALAGLAPLDSVGLAQWVSAFPVLTDDEEIASAYRALLAILSQPGCPVLDKEALLRPAIVPVLQTHQDEDKLATDPALRTALIQLVQ